MTAELDHRTDETQTLVSATQGQGEVALVDKIQAGSPEPEGDEIERPADGIYVTEAQEASYGKFARYRGRWALVALVAAGVVAVPTVKAINSTGIADERAPSEPKPITNAQAYRALGLHPVSGNTKIAEVDDSTKVPVISRVATQLQSIFNNALYGREKDDPRGSYAAYGPYTPSAITVNEPEASLIAQGHALDPNFPTESVTIDEVSSATPLPDGNTNIGAQITFIEDQPLPPASENGVPAPRLSRVVFNGLVEVGPVATPPELSAGTPQGLGKFKGSTILVIKKLSGATTVTPLSWRTGTIAQAS